MFGLLYVLVSFTLFVENESARILAVFPTPLISHQSAHRAIIHELIHRDHEVVLVTPLPEFPRGKSPDNLMEIDVSNATNEVWKEKYILNVKGQNKFIDGGLKHALRVAAKAVQKQFLVPEVQSFIKNNETFDLLLLEAWIRPTLFWTYICEAPVISISSFGPVFNDYTNLGGPAHPVLYPTVYQQDMQNMNPWQKMLALYENWKIDSMYDSLEKEENEMARDLFGDVPSLREQVRRIEMLLLNVHPVWQGVRPVPMNVVHLGGLHLQDRELMTINITAELKEYLNSCINGLVYINLDTNTGPWTLPEHTQRTLIQAFSLLPWPVLWQLEGDVSGLPHNVRVHKWLPQAKLLEHPNIRLFISQGGQQSIDEAIAAAVPLLVLPHRADQRRNAELVLRHNIGTVLDLEKADAEKVKNEIQLAMRNEGYRTNLLRLRTLLFDAPTLSPVHAVDAIEYVLRHTGGHLVSPTLQVHWSRYIELELLIIVITVIIINLLAFYTILCYAYKKLVCMIVERRAVRGRYKGLL